jgi:hypothetical protein
VVGHLLAARRHAAEERAPTELQVWALVERRAGDEEHLLLEADVDRQPISLVAHHAEEACAL